MIPFTKSLNTKLLLIVVCFVALSGALAAFRQQAIETKRLQMVYDNRLLRLGQTYQKRVEDELHQRQQLLAAAHEIVVRQLFQQNQTPAPEGFSVTRDEDLAYRLFDGISGVFIHKDRDVNAETLRLIYQSRDLWEYLAPMLETHFSAFYFITPERMTRIWPADIAAAHLPDHDVTREIFFTLAAPAENPQGEARWSPIYFDQYANDWMMSLLMPVYKDGVFVGVIGGDLRVQFLYQQFASLDVSDNRVQAFVFDNQKNLILHGERLLAETEADKVTVDERKDVSADLAQYIHQAINAEIKPGKISSHEINNRPYQVSYGPLNNMNWYVGLYYPYEVINQHLRKTLQDIYLNIVLLMVFLSVILYYSLKYFVTDRISRLALSAASVDQNHWQLQNIERGQDEIGLLGNTIHTMLVKINDLVSGLNTNISQLEAARVNAEKLTSAIEHTSSLIVILNRDWLVEYANPQFWRTSGYLPEDALGGEDALLLDKTASENSQFDTITKALHESVKVLDGQRQNSEWRAEYLAKRRDGSSFWLMQTISAVFSPEGEVQYFVCVGQDVSSLKDTQQKIEHLAYYDQLTGLQNRVLFKDQLRLALNICIRDKSHLALMYLDLDHFKRINDTLGHEAGDTLLVEVAYRLKQCLRTEDLIARLGGDEFAVLLHQVGSAQYAYVIANKIIAVLNEPVLLMGQEVIIGVSIGITLAPDDSQSVATLMKNADLAMYQAKEKGRNSFQFYTADMNHQVEHRLRLERDLYHALKHQEFELYYQPVIDLRSGQVISAEALIRWNHPLRGVIPPTEFIAIAEDSGLIVPLGNWVIRAACQQAKNIQKALHRPLKIGVNISARQLYQPGFPNDFRHILAEIRLAPEWLELEITESGLMDDDGKAIDCLEQIRAMGVSLAIDDFGTGYSSLSHLKRLPVQSLKVDRSFVEGLPDDEEDRAITSLVVAMANSLDYKVVVEGVETWEQLQFLTACGCDYAQGFYFSEPLPADKFMQLLFQWPPSGDVLLKKED